MRSGTEQEGMLLPHVSLLAGYTLTNIVTFILGGNIHGVHGLGKGTMFGAIVC